MWMTTRKVAKERFLSGGENGEGDELLKRKVRIMERDLMNYSSHFKEMMDAPMDG
ncbi:unnamed protein product [Amoebophrya sp. A25]|nr:unnamed protein product [Amoebophrya sp. A25]|eukprot:GSA25T00013888001.1